MGPLEANPRLVWARRSAAKSRSWPHCSEKGGHFFFEFPLLKIRTELTVEQKKRIAAEQELALKGPCQKALAAARTEKEWEDLWSERRPDKHFQLQDALSKSSSSSSEKNI